VVPSGVAGLFAVGVGSALVWAAGGAVAGKALIGAGGGGASLERVAK
jgi:hypothetical protein